MFDGRVDIDCSFRSITTNITKLEFLDACSGMKNGEKQESWKKHGKSLEKQIFANMLYVEDLSLDNLN